MTLHQLLHLGAVLVLAPALMLLVTLHSTAARDLKPMFGSTDHLL
jgi:hypothetical protein